MEEILGHTAEGIDGILETVNARATRSSTITSSRACSGGAANHGVLEAREAGLRSSSSRTARADCHRLGPAQSHRRHADFHALLAERSFHLDTYCFDSKPEMELFLHLLRDPRVRLIYFTGMLTHGQSDFYVQYIDPDSHAVRSYFPDFLMKTDDGGYIIVEVKGDHQVDEPVVMAKKRYAEEMAGASGMRYEMIKGTDAEAGRYGVLFGDGGQLQVGLLADQRAHA